jgi:hypothetical protein
LVVVVRAAARAQARPWPLAVALPCLLVAALEIWSLETVRPVPGLWLEVGSGWAVRGRVVRGRVEVGVAVKPPGFLVTRV